MGADLAELSKEPKAVQGRGESGNNEIRGASAGQGGVQTTEILEVHRIPYDLCRLEVIRYANRISYIFAPAGAASVRIVTKNVSDKSVLFPV